MGCLLEIVILNDIKGLLVDIGTQINDTVRYKQLHMTFIE